MRSILSVTTAATVRNLTTLERVKAELSITDNASDVLLLAKIREASSDINARAWADPYETLTETFWNVACEEYLILRRRPNVTITSVTNDDDATNTYYRIDPETGLLYCLDVNGYPLPWISCKSIIVVYSAGYIMPGQTGANLEAALEAAAIELVQSYWMSRGRDATIKSESVPGLGDVTYWVGSIGESGELPPSVESKLTPFRRTAI